MSEHMIYTDPDHNNLIWFKFEGPDWNEYNTLMNQLEAAIRAPGPPTCVIFAPTVDLPSGNPLPHMQRLTRMPGNYQRFELLIVIVPPWMKLAKAFANIVLKLINNGGEVKLVTTEAEARQAYDYYNLTKLADSV